MTVMEGKKYKKVANDRRNNDDENSSNNYCYGDNINANNNDSDDNNNINIAIDDKDIKIITIEALRPYVMVTATVIMTTAAITI